MPSSSTTCSAVAALLLLLVGAAACQSGGSAQPRTATVSALRDSTQAYLGERVAVEGTVARVFGERAFSMDGQAGSVLVVFVAPSAEMQNARSATRPVETGDRVRVTGTARRFVTAVSERDAAQDVDIDYEDENPALVAQRVARLAPEEAP